MGIKYFIIFGGILFIESEKVLGFYSISAMAIALLSKICYNNHTRFNYDFGQSWLLNQRQNKI